MSDEADLYKNLVDYDEDVEVQLKKPLVAASKSPSQRRWCSPGIRKCLFITLITSTVLFVATGVIIYSWVSYAVDHLTVTTPSPKFPVVDMTDAELTAVKTRVELFVDQIVAGEQPENDLILTQDEINGFLGHSDYLRGNMMVHLHKDLIKEEFSLPMYMFPGGRGRYFVGDQYLLVDEDTETIDTEMKTAATHEDWFDGPLFFAQVQYLVSNHTLKYAYMMEMFLKKGSFFGQEVPQDYIDRRENLLQELYENDDCDGAKIARALIDGVEHVAIKEGMIIVKPRKH